MLRHSSLDDIEYSKYSSSTRKSIQNRQRRRHHHSKTKRRRRNSNYSIDKCAVCLDDEHLSDTKLFPCGHSFHGQCLIQWVTTTKGRKFNCPLCRQDIAHFIQMTGNQQLNNQLIQIWNEHYIYNSPSLSPEEPQEKDMADKQIDVEIDITSKSPDCETSECTKKQCIQTITITEEVPLSISIQKKDVLSTTKDIGHELSISSNIEQVEHPQANVKVITHSSVYVDDVEQSDNRSIWKFIWKSPLSFLYQQKNDSKSCIINSLLPPIYDTNVSYHDVDADQSSHSHSSPEFEAPITMYHNQRKYEEPKHEREHEPLSNTTHEAVIPITSTNNNDSNPSPNLLNFSILNVKSGILAGLCAGSSTFLMAQQIRHELVNHGTKGVISGSIRKSFIPIMSETVPSVAVFFTSYEHLKRYLFDIDNINNPNSLTFSQRFISAGIASSIAYYLPHKIANKSITMTSTKGLLPFRFATFFGTFELSKDIMNKKHDELNLFQVASSAAIGGTISHGLYYPLTQSISRTHMFALNVIPPSGNGNSFRIAGPATARVLYRGWVSSLSKFLPSCVVCSCAFEYSKRYFSQS